MLAFPSRPAGVRTSVRGPRLRPAHVGASLGTIYWWTILGAIYRTIYRTFLGTILGTIHWAVRNAAAAPILAVAGTLAAALCSTAAATTAAALAAATTVILRPSTFAFAAPTVALAARIAAATAAVALPVARTVARAIPVALAALVAATASGRAGFAGILGAISLLATVPLAPPTTAATAGLVVEVGALRHVELVAVEHHALAQRGAHLGAPRADTEQAAAGMVQDLDLDLVAADAELVEGDLDRLVDGVSLGFDVGGHDSLFSCRAGSTATAGRSKGRCWKASRGRDRRGS
jgi:hypothetical protein